MRRWPLFHPRDALHIAAAGFETELGSLQQAVPELESLTPEQARRLVPVLRDGYVSVALLERGGGDLDVDAILQGFRRALLKAGGTVVTNAEVTGLARSRGQWLVHTETGVHSAQIVVNAAGAWADQVAERAGVRPLDLQPRRRTALLIPQPATQQRAPVSDWPFVIQAGQPLYFRPDAGALLLSPIDETASAACDAQPEEFDVATAAARFEAATDVTVSNVTHRWAGLRTFAADESFVVGYDPKAEGFFWFAGQGGYGVQAAPALARLARGLVDERVDPSLQPYIAAVSPERLV